MTYMRELIQEEARTWVDTPYKHQHKAKGLGVDCANLIIMVGTSLEVMEVTEEAFRPFKGYSRLPNPRRMDRAMNRFLRPAPADMAEPGDIALMCWDVEHKVPQHMAILAERKGRPMLIHADGNVGRVVEHGFAGIWPQLVASWWRYPGLCNGDGRI